MKRFFFIVAIFPALLFAQGKGRAAAKPVEEELATVAIVDYFNKTGSKDYEFLSSSISSAIAERMKEKFQFIRAPEKKAQAEVSAAYALNPVLDPVGLQTITTAIPSDMIVYGEFDFNRATNEVTIVSSIYIRQVNVLITLDPVVNPGDSTIFNATETIADQLVAEIARIASSSREEEPVASQEATPEKSEEKTEDGKEEKIVLTKSNVAQPKPPKTRDYKTWFVTGELLGPAWYGSVGGGAFFTRNIYLQLGGMYVPRLDFDFWGTYGGLGFTYGYFDLQIGPSLYFFIPQIVSSFKVSTNYVAAYLSTGAKFSWQQYFVKPSVVYIKDLQNLSDWDFGGKKSFLTFGLQLGVRF